jgi:hypothetical protein
MSAPKLIKVWGQVYRLAEKARLADFGRLDLNLLMRRSPRLSRDYWQLIDWVQQQLAAGQQPVGPDVITQLTDETLDQIAHEVLVKSQQLGEVPPALDRSGAQEFRRNVIQYLRQYLPAQILHDATDGGYAG